MGDGPKRTTSGTRARNPIVLVADDDLEFLVLLSEFLATEGFAVIPAKSGAAALSIARVARPDAILLDLTLPDMDGIDVARDLRADDRTQHIPVILLTGHSVEVIDVADLGLEGALSKTCGPDVLLEQLRAALKRSGHTFAGSR
jgi:chemosensory pili system protein ChpA (sensor histidine kinase/response regulator)